MTNVTLRRQDFLDELDYLSYIGSKLFLCPFIGRAKTKIICFHFVYFLLVLTSVQQLFTLCWTGFGNWMMIINIAPNLGVCLMSTIKYTKIHNNNEFYSKVFYHFREDIWELVPDHSTDNFSVMNRYTDYSKFIYKFLFSMVVTLVIVVDSFPWIIMTFESKVLNKDSQYLYPFDACYPFDKVKWYSIVYIWESFMTAVVICIYGFSNALHMSYIAFICMELRLLGNWLKGLITDKDVDNTNKQKGVKETHDEIKRNLKFVIKKHRFLSIISKELDAVLGDSMLLSYTFGSVFICLTAFSFTVVDDLYTSLRYLSFFLSLLIEMFNQCIIGQVLIDHSEDLSKMIYSSNWILADQQTKKSLLMLMVRVQKPFKLTANGCLTMDLNTFSRICSSSYQLFNLLRTIYQPLDH